MAGRGGFTLVFHRYHDAVASVKKVFIFNTLIMFNVLYY